MTVVTEGAGKSEKLIQNILRAICPYEFGKVGHLVIGSIIRLKAKDIAFHAALGWTDLNHVKKIKLLDL